MVLALYFQQLRSYFYSLRIKDSNKNSKLLIDLKSVAQFS
jgi:hypothetical protein